MWVILVGPVFGGRCGAEALGLGLGLSLGPAYRFALPPGLAAKTTRCLVFDQGRPTSHLHYRYLRSQIERISPDLSCVSLQTNLSFFPTRKLNLAFNRRTMDSFLFKVLSGIEEVIGRINNKYFSAKFVYICMYTSQVWFFNRTIFSLTNY